MFTWVRVSRRTVMLADGTNQFYDVQLELSVKGINQTGGGDPSNFPHVGCQSGNIGVVQGPTAANIGGVTTMPAAPIVGNMMLYFYLGRTGTADPPLTGSWATAGSTLVIGSGTTTFGLFYKVVAVGETGWDTGNIGAGGDKAYFVEFSGVDTFDVAANAGGGTSVNIGTVAVTPTAGKTALLVSVVDLVDDAFDQTFTPVAGMTELLEIPPNSPQGTINYEAVASTSGSYTVGSTWPANPFEQSGVIGAAFYCSGSDNPPGQGQWIYNEIPTPPPGGGVRVFFTKYPYADGSLTVKVDNVNQTAAITTYDGATGSFTLAFDPRSYEIVTVTYQGR